MDIGALVGRSILIVEDEPLIAFDLRGLFEAAGANVVIARDARRATEMVEADGLSAAILDYRLGGSDSSGLCTRLHERQIPFVIYTGYPDVPAQGAWSVIIRKPSGGAVLVDTITHLLS
jgi:DNA-binding NtrC family response regulator